MGECGSDAELFLQAGDTALWRGLYLEDLASEDSTVKDSLYLALFEKTKILLETNPQEVARVASILVEAKSRLLEVGEAMPSAWQAFLSSS